MLATKFWRNSDAASAVEFAIVSAPFLFLLMAVVQVGIFYMTQSALDTGVIRTAETLRNNFTTGSSATLLNAAALKSSVATNAGSLVTNNSTLAVEIRQLSNLSSSAVAIVDGTNDYGTTTSTLVIRAKFTAITLAPGLSGLSTLTSSALVRRQGT
jgi:Flp pilus assembly protein TadG